jgi:hypothetical protein
LPAWQPLKKRRINTTTNSIRMDYIDVWRLKLVRCPRSIAAAHAVLPSMSLLPLAPFFHLPFYFLLCYARQDSKIYFESATTCDRSAVRDFDIGRSAFCGLACHSLVAPPARESFRSSPVRRRITRHFFLRSSRFSRRVHPQA